MNAIDRTKRSELIQPGQSFGKFYLVQTIGEGGTSRIFKALQQPINRLVALKIPSFTESGSILTPDEFLSEATLMAKLEHPNVVRIYDFGVSEDQAFICMEYVEGLNLQEWVQAQGPLSLSATLALGLQTLDALIHSHAQDVLHLDLSPANLLLSKSGMIKLLDFGMAGKRQPKTERKVFGTPAFLSPEHVKGKVGTRQSDLFSFSSLLFFAVSGEQLFDPGDENVNLAGMLRAIESARENPPEAKLKSLSPSLAKIVRLGLTGATAEEIAIALKTAWANLEGERSPSQVLLRETQGNVHLEGGVDSLPTGEKLRDLYFELRESGRHREAVALLEKALRREPNNPLLAELLTTPPTKAKAIPATMEVNGPSSSGSASVQTPESPIPRVPYNPIHLAHIDANSKSKSKSKSQENRWLPLSLGLLVFTLAAYLLWDKLGAQTSSSPSSVKAAAIDKPITSIKSATSSQPISPPTQPASPPNPSSSPTLVAKTQVEKIPTQAKAPQLSNPIKDNVVQKVRNRPALAIEGPEGIKVSLNDSVDWISPSPKGGWILNPGLINLSLTLPGSLRPINSSLFISNDSLYLIRLEADGGFSVVRQLR
jgi:serine/threonine protein kinase